MKPRFLLILLFFFGVIGCNKEDNSPVDESEECSQLHFGLLTLSNLSGYELAFNFANGKEMDRYGVMPDSAVVTLDKIYSGWVTLSCLNIQTGEVKEYLITVADCKDTNFALR